MYRLYKMCCGNYMSRDVNARGNFASVWHRLIKCWLKWNIENCCLLFGQWVLDKYFLEWILEVVVDVLLVSMLMIYSRLFSPIKPDIEQLPCFPTPLHPSFTLEMPQVPDTGSGYYDVDDDATFECLKSLNYHLPSSKHSLWMIGSPISQNLNLSAFPWISTPSPLSGSWNLWNDKEYVVLRVFNHK